MSDPDREPTSEEEAALRRLLAEARLDGPIPPEEAARLDRVIEQLGDETFEDGPAPATGVDLAAQRRRRGGQLLVAAAAIVVAGFGIGSVVGPDDGGDESAASGTAQDLSADGTPPDRDGEMPEEGDEAELAQPSEEGASRLRGDNFDNDDGAADSAAPEQSAEEAPTALSQVAPADVRPVRITDRRFAAQVRELRESRTLRQRGVYAENSGAALRAFARWDRCNAAPWGAGTLLAARYDGVPGVLAFREPTGSTQVVELLQCGSGDIVRSLTVSTR